MTDSSTYFTWTEYEKIKCIGTGGFGTVYLCKHPKYKTCVVKEIHIETTQDDEVVSVSKEAGILSSLSHPNIINYMTHSIISRTMFIVMEYAPGGDLDRYLRSKTEDVKEKEAVEMLAGVTCGLAHIHEKDIIHRDLSARNVLVCRGGVLKLSDFGISRRAGSMSSGGPHGNPGYFAPELCWGGAASKASDMWALGCLLYHIAWRQEPFSAPSLAGTIRLIVGAKCPKLPASYSRGLSSLLAELLAKSPGDRPDCASLLAHPCLAVAVHSTVPSYRPLASVGTVLSQLGFDDIC